MTELTRARATAARGPWASEQQARLGKAALLDGGYHDPLTQANNDVLVLFAEVPVESQLSEARQCLGTAYRQTPETVTFEVANIMAQTEGHLTGSRDDNPQGPGPF